MAGGGSAGASARARVRDLAGQSAERARELVASALADGATVEVSLGEAVTLLADAVDGLVKLSEQQEREGSDRG